MFIRRPIKAPLNVACCFLCDDRKQRYHVAKCVSVLMKPKNMTKKCKRKPVVYNGFFLYDFDSISLPPEIILFFCRLFKMINPGTIV